MSLPRVALVPASAPVPTAGPSAPSLAARLGLGLLLTVVGTPSPAPAQGPATGAVRELAPLPDPPLEDLEPEVREVLRAQRAQVEELFGRDDVPADALARAYADLGRLYLAYELAGPAETCLRNALLLAPDDARSEYHLALLDLEQRRWERAAERFARVVARRPTDAAGWLRLGEAHLGNGSAAQAEEAYTRAADLLEDDERAAAASHYGLGRVALLGNDLRAAVAHFEAALAAQPGARRIHYLLAQAHRGLGEDDQAQRHADLYGEGEISFPEPLVAELRGLVESVDFHLAAGDRAFVAGQDAFAEGSYRRALELDPDEPQAHQGLAAVLERQGEREAAVRELEEVIRLDDGDVAARVHLGRLLAELERPEEAAPVLEEALRRDLRHERAALLLASVYSGLGRPQDALELYERVLEWAPQHPVALLARPLVLEALGRAEEAKRELARVMELAPEDHGVRVNYATMLSETGELEAAQAELETVLDAEGVADPLRALALYNLGVIEAKRGSDEGALARFGAALELDPDLVAARFHRGNTLARTGRYGGAATDFEGVIERQADHLPAHLGLATALVLAQRYGDAVAALTAGLRAIPGDPNLIHALARLLATCPEQELRDGQRAVELATKVFQRTGAVEYGETVAMGYAEMGAFEDAVRWQRNLLRAAEETAADPRLLARLRTNLELFERGERP